MQMLAWHGPFAMLALALSACASADTVAPGAPASTPPIPTATPLAIELPSSPFGPILLRDDFRKPPLNPRKWRMTTDIPQGQARVFVDGGQAVMVNRGHLVTRADFPPRALGGIRISGDWTFAGSDDDFIQILTRSNGFPDRSNPFGETADGIEFLAYTAAVFEDPNLMLILGRGPADGTVTNLSSSGSLVVRPGGTYHFVVVDDGRTLAFTLTDASNASNSRTLTARSEYAGASNHVTFHNREYCCLGTHRAFLDNVRIARREQ